MRHPESRLQRFVSLLQLRGHLSSQLIGLLLPDDLLERTPVLARFANRRIDEVASLRRIDPSTERRGEGLRHDQPLRQVQVPAHSIGVYLQRAQH